MEVGGDMKAQELFELLDVVDKGDSSIKDVLSSTEQRGFMDLEDVKLDTSRKRRTGFSEIIYSATKTDDQLLKIAVSLQRTTDPVLFTRIAWEQVQKIQQVLPQLEYHAQAKLAGLNCPAPSYAPVGVLAAGSSDLAVAEEAAITAQYLGCPVERIYDVGVAGLHRLLCQMERLKKMAALVVVAGMDGALPSVVTGLVSCPVFGVPTSIGYGTSFGGVSALLSMLNSCSMGLSVLNIDNGVGGGYCAAMVARGGSC